MAVALLGEAWNAVLAAVADPQSRAEACTHIHQLQNLVLAQAAIRSAPDLLRQPPIAVVGEAGPQIHHPV